MISETELSLASLGLLLLVSGFLLWRSSKKREQLQHSSPWQQLQREQQRQAQAPEAIIQAMEVRLFDYGREVEGRVETTLQLLDQLILDAEQEVQRLERLLHASRSEELSADEPIPAEAMRRLPLLIQAGLTEEEIARCLHISVAQIRQWRDHPADDDQAAAA